MRAYRALVVGVSILWTVLAFGAVLPPQVQWEKVYGGDSADRQPCLARTSDGGFILGAHSYSGISGNKQTPNFGEWDYWVIRLDQDGNKVWDATFGGSFWDELWAVQQTSDGGFILAGVSQSPASGNKTAPRSDGYSDAWIVRLDTNGHKLWDKAFGGRHIAGDWYQVRAVVETPGQGFLVAGSVRGDFWILRLNASGQKLWERAYGGAGDDFLTHALQTPDQGFLLAGHSASGIGGSKTSTNYGGNDLWFIRVDAAGNPIWDRSYGGASNDETPRVIQTTDGGFGVGARTTSGISGNKTSTFFGQEGEDYWVLRLDGNGNKVWEQTFGGPRWDWLTDLQQSVDGGFFLAGFSLSDVGGNKTAPLLNRYDVWTVRLDPMGARVWDQTYDGSHMLAWPRLETTADGGIMIAASAVGDPTDPGTSDLILLKLSGETLRGPVPPPAIEWQRTFGGTGDDWPYCIVQTPDGGCVVAGETSSGRTGNKESDNHGATDGWVLRLDARGNKLWEANLGGTGDEKLRGIQNTADGGFIVAGESSSPPSGNKTSPLYGESDFWVVRLDRAGNKLWDKSFGGTQTDEAFSVVQTSDGGFLVAGSSQSPADGNKTLPPFLNPPTSPLAMDYWIVRLDADGNKLWENVYGGLSWDMLTDARRTTDNGFLLAGFSGSATGGSKTSTNFSASEDFWVVRVDGSGNTVWDKTYGGLLGEQAAKVIITSDGGSLLGGVTQSDPGGNKTSPFHGGAYDYWVVRLDANGNKLWDQDFGGEGWDLLGGMLQTADGGFVLSGSSQSPASGNKTSPLLYWSDMWVVRLDRDGNKVWEQTYNGTHAVASVNVCAAKDGGLFLSAGGQSTAPASDFVVMKLGPDSLSAPRLERLVRVGNDLRFTLAGIPARTYVTEWSGDLRTWSPLATNRLVSGAAEVVDGTGLGKRFYRARMLE